MNHNVLDAGIFGARSFLRKPPFGISASIEGVNAACPVFFVSDSTPPSTPACATWPVFGTITVLLTGALILDVALSPSWADPFREPETWVLVGVIVGMVLRGTGQWLARRGCTGEEICRRLSLGVWAAAALGGLISLVF